MKIHIVQKGETLWKIAKKYGVDFEELKKSNAQLSNPELIMPGMKIKVPSAGVPVKHAGAGSAHPKEYVKKAGQKEFPAEPKILSIEEEEEPEAQVSTVSEMPAEQKESAAQKETPVQKVTTQKEVQVTKTKEVQVTKEVQKEAKVAPAAKKEEVPVVKKEVTKVAAIKEKVAAIKEKAAAVKEITKAVAAKKEEAPVVKPEVTKEAAAKKEAAAVKAEVTKVAAAKKEAAAVKAEVTKAAVKELEEGKDNTKFSVNILPQPPQPPTKSLNLASELKVPETVKETEHLFVAPAAEKANIVAPAAEKPIVAPAAEKANIVAPSVEKPIVAPAAEKANIVAPVSNPNPFISPAFDKAGTYEAPFIDLTKPYQPSEVQFNPIVSPIWDQGVLNPLSQENIQPLIPPVPTATETQYAQTPFEQNPYVPYEGTLPSYPPLGTQSYAEPYTPVPSSPAPYSYPTAPPSYYGAPTQETGYPYYEAPVPEAAHPYYGAAPVPAAVHPYYGAAPAPEMGYPYYGAPVPEAAHPYYGAAPVPEAAHPYYGAAPVPEAAHPYYGAAPVPEAAHPYYGAAPVPEAAHPYYGAPVPEAGYPYYGAPAPAAVHPYYGAPMPEAGYMQPGYSPYAPVPAFSPESPSLSTPTSNETLAAAMENQAAPLEEDCGCEEPQAINPYAPQPGGLYGMPYYPALQQTPYLQSSPYAPQPGTPFYRPDQTAVFGLPSNDDDDEK